MKTTIFPVLVLLTAPLLAHVQTSKRPLFFSHDSTSFSATGKWVPNDPKEKEAFPSETELDCFKQNMSCVEATADYSFGHPHVTVSFLRVIQWDKNVLILRSDAVCMTQTAVVTFADKTITSTLSMKQLNEQQKKACNFLGAEKTETWSFVLRGSERWEKEYVQWEKEHGLK
jgi:hypothetical protein